MPSSDELATLTRLTQEAFAELVKVKERLNELEEDAGIGPGSAQAGATSLTAGAGAMGTTRSRPGAAGGAQQQQQHPHGRHRLAGVLRLGGGLLWAQEGGGGDAAGALRAAGLKLGTDALLQLAAVVRGGRDSVHAECRLDAREGHASLRKVRSGEPQQWQAGGGRVCAWVGGVRVVVVVCVCLVGVEAGWGGQVGCQLAEALQWCSSKDEGVRGLRPSRGMLAAPPSPCAGAVQLPAGPPPAADPGALWGAGPGCRIHAESPGRPGDSAGPRRTARACG